MAQVSKIQDTNGNQFDINATTVNDHTVESDVPQNAAILTVVDGVVNITYEEETNNE